MCFEGSNEDTTFLSDYVPPEFYSTKITKLRQKQILVNLCYMFSFSGAPALLRCTTLGIHFGDCTGLGWKTNIAISMNTVRHIWDTYPSCRVEGLAEESVPRDCWGLN